MKCILLLNNQSLQLKDIFFSNTVKTICFDIMTEEHVDLCAWGEISVSIKKTKKLYGLNDDLIIILLY